MSGKITTTISWIALIVSIVAVILAVAAFNRAGENIDDTVQQEVQDFFNQNRQNLQQAPAEAAGTATE